MKGEGFDRNLYYCVVGFLDMMGISTEMAKLTILPNDKKGQEKYKRQVEGIIQRFKAFRCYCDNPFQETAVARTSWISGTLVGSERFQVKHLSDSSIIHGKLSDKTAGVPKVDVLYTVLRGMCCVMFNSLTNGIPVRGTVCVGTGIEAGEFPGELLGSALTSSVKLEATVGSPSILIDQSVVVYLQYVKNRTAKVEKREKASILKVVSDCEDLIMVNTATGKHYLDFLSVWFLDSLRLDLMDQMYGLFPQLYKFTESQCQNVDLSPKVHDYYVELFAYVESRKDVWGF